MRLHPPLHGAPPPTLAAPAGARERTDREKRRPRGREGEENAAETEEAVAGS